MTKPTRAQQQARQMLAQALLSVSEAAKLDGTANFTASTLKEVAASLAKASSAFGVQDIAALAFELRLKSLGYTTETVEMLTLIDQKLSTIEMIYLDAERLKAIVADAEAELG